MDYRKEFLAQVDNRMKKSGEIIKILAVSGPNGAGKTTLIKGILRKFPGRFCEIKLITTGSPHGNDGARRFVSNERFLREKIVVGWAAGFCESGYSLQNLMKAILKNKIIIFEGIFRLEQLKKILGKRRVQSMIVGVLPPGNNIQEMIDALETRLSQRVGYCPKDVMKKLLDARNRVIPGILAKAQVILCGCKGQTSSNATIIMKKWETIYK